MQSFSRAVRAAFAATALVAGTFAAVPAAAADDGYQRGPDPTEESIEAPRGTFEIAAAVITRAAADGFGGGTVYYPTDTSDGTFEDDIIAPVRSHSERFYESLPADGDKAYPELRDASHSAPTMPDTTIARYSVSWLKLYVDNDERYEQFLWPPPDVDAEISEYRSTC